ncbi:MULTISPECIES: carbon starvation CstA family protein [Bacillus cereus group]|uniref:Carbon starvation protein A n=1 Tax=Bacillus thuringiensis subsp. konkukian (strain 97-27) TaxID=281309 RepID=Q6HKC7_BACHK|nr:MULTISPECIES: carbon starvation CstA family protein [Bacillus cereus group]AAT59589.1 carbon starvation protein A [[Bacillus thuringiensis] serovar konkukian str. 97-27]AJI32182.1 carbon starvation CstA family protein [Bacillus thuringiensis]MDA2509834.1 carbon starvation protein A [Bacillus cereus]QKI24372.1 carbon starvation protein A [Bacillus thuringiensis]RXG11096.1 carbon starvation protein A [Bacillus cereus]
MITFLVSIVVLIIGYFTYGKFIEKIFGVNYKRKTPAYVNQDGVDYVPMDRRKNSMIQLLNIAGTGPIFGPILGALYGPVAFVWIVIGAIFAGAVHDYLTGMISIRNKGAHIPELAGKFLGNAMRHIVNVFSLLLLVLVGTVFITTPASLLDIVLQGKVSITIILSVIFVYYILSTILPIDKIIGKIYPVLGALLLISAIGIGGMMIIKGSPIPELTFENMHPDNAPIFPLLMLTITCGALSGFHATQSPIISRTLQTEKHGRYVFFGMMIAEAIIAMIWAAAAMSIFSYGELNELIKSGTPAAVVSEISKTMLGAVGGTIAVIGVIVLPITSGDTAFRAARSIIADYFNFEQTKLKNRLIIAIPLFVIAYGLTKIDFTLLWRYFSWANQSTAAIALWIGTMYLFIKGKPYVVSLIPAIFMTLMTVIYILNAKIGFNIPLNTSYIIGAVITVILTAIFFMKAMKNKNENIEVDVQLEKEAV